MFTISQLWFDFSSKKYSDFAGHKKLLVQVEKFTTGGCEFESHHWHPHCKFLYWYQEFLCPVEPLYFSDEKSTIVEKR